MVGWPITVRSIRVLIRWIRKFPAIEVGLRIGVAVIHQLLKVKIAWPFLGRGFDSRSQQTNKPEDCQAIQDKQQLTAPLARPDHTRPDTSFVLVPVSSVLRSFLPVMSTFGEYFRVTT